MKKIFSFLLVMATVSMAASYPFTHDGFFFNFSVGLQDRWTNPSLYDSARYGSPGRFGLTEADDDEILGSTEFGFGFQLAAGKEWWVSENWGMGASIALNYGSVEESEEDAEMSALAITVMLSATFN